MEITLSITQVLQGVYADAALMSASTDCTSRPALLRREQGNALKRLCMTAWGVLMGEICGYIGDFAFTPTSYMANEDPELLSLTLTSEEAERHGPAMRLQLSTALERRLLSMAYGTAYPELARANEALAERAVGGFIRLARGEIRPTSIEPWG
ncbi:MAG: hypothetical protein K2L96_01730 [Muribaculaceae bacterium]|nr:hypothetical protein [Muribaculaceae bacterium]